MCGTVNVPPELLQCSAVLDQAGGAGLAFVLILSQDIRI